MCLNSAEVVIDAFGTYLLLQKLQLLLGFSNLMLKLLEFTRGLVFVEIVFTLCKELLLGDIEKVLVTQAKSTLSLCNLLS